jgi:hypothetical protein
MDKREASNILKSMTLCCNKPHSIWENPYIVSVIHAYGFVMGRLTMTPILKPYGYIKPLVEVLDAVGGQPYHLYAIDTECVIISFEADQVETIEIEKQIIVLKHT